MTNTTPNASDDDQPNGEAERLGIDANDEVLGAGGELDAEAEAKLGETPDPSDGRDPRDL